MRILELKERQEEHDKKFNVITEELRELRRISNKHDERLRNIEAYMEKTSITLEEEAREVIEYRLREKGYYNEYW
jgi:hypothetical protein